MPNWCYNSVSLELDDSKYQEIKNLITKIKVDEKNIPECLIKNIMDYIFNYSESEDYIGNAENIIKDELLSSDKDLSNFETRWVSASEELRELSFDLPFVKIINEYEITQDDIEGVDVIFEGEYLSETNWNIGENNWFDYGEECLEEVKNILLSYEFEIDDKKIKFDTIENLKLYCQNNNLDTLLEEIDLETYMIENDLCNCEEYFKQGIEKILDI